ncbi:MAG: class II fumarate hydratase [Bacteriovoracaceae bacterium]|jgi:fumarate hydratase class II|nr:class II fumarate hydratase [Bacteriovoracaceae bacterium]
MKTREETDSLGSIAVPQDKLWGAQTQRSLNHFSIGDEKMPSEFIKTYALVKKIAAHSNLELGLLPNDKYEAIAKAANEIMEGKLYQHFPLSIWQTGSGTQTNMNLNEVISNRANELLGSKRGCHSPIHPNDDVNMGQSSNDTFPTATHICCYRLINDKLLPSLNSLINTTQKKVTEFKDVQKVGRTHLQDALPLGLDEEFSGYLTQLEFSLTRIQHSLKSLERLAIGGTAIGTGANTHKNFAEHFVKTLNRETSLKFTVAYNKFEAIAAHDSLVEVHGCLKTLAVSLTKIANDIRWLSSGPRCAFNEINIPKNEPGSSIMPGKVNPTQCEAILMICTQVIGNDVAVSIGGGQGNFELNTYKPLLLHNLVSSIKTLAEGITSFDKYCMQGLNPNKKRIQHFMEENIMIATFLAPAIGYEATSKIALSAYNNETSLKDEVLKAGLISEEKFNKLINKSR